MDWKAGRERKGIPPIQAIPGRPERLARISSTDELPNLPKLVRMGGQAVVGRPESLAWTSGHSRLALQALLEMKSWAGCLVFHPGTVGHSGQASKGTLGDQGSLGTQGRLGCQGNQWLNPVLRGKGFDGMPSRLVRPGEGSILSPSVQESRSEPDHSPLRRAEVRPSEMNWNSSIL